MHRILDLASCEARLYVKHRQLVIERANQVDSLPLNEASIVVVSQGQVSLTNSVLVGLLESGGMLVTCNRNFLPVGMMLPLAGNHIQVERFAAQINASRPTNKRIWQQIIRTKIGHQAATLQFLHEQTFGLDRLIGEVKSGDPANIEARAARRYWSRLFADQQFRRDRDLPGINAILNYAYAVLRAIVARSIAACGLHPSVGIHHHNRYSMFPLADDLMEPFRPLLDLEVASHLAHFGEQERLTPKIKRAILEVVLGKFECGNEKRTLFDIANRMASSLVEVYAGSRKNILIPGLISNERSGNDPIGV